MLDHQIRHRKELFKGSLILDILYEKSILLEKWLKQLFTFLPQEPFLLVGPYTWQNYNFIFLPLNKFLLRFYTVLEILHYRQERNQVIFLILEFFDSLLFTLNIQNVRYGLKSIKILAVPNDAHYRASFMSQTYV